MQYGCRQHDPCGTLEHWAAALQQRRQAPLAMPTDPKVKRQATGLIKGSLARLMLSPLPLAHAATRQCTRPLGRSQASSPKQAGRPDMYPPKGHRADPSRPGNLCIQQAG
ncbi:hypothetical protein NDU88_008619 [Pleurodeles waltl]|uniref:Uncharacterized protein n=1 Tax=Pleurodeles waltl TaxID=8319 RepID=A0AAV7PX62_PLEWA|nr:hypothetical protein NDU88_008619 [Pleurodeles waltl]